MPPSVKKGVESRMSVRFEVVVLVLQRDAGGAVAVHGLGEGVRTFGADCLQLPAFGVKLWDAVADESLGVFDVVEGLLPWVCTRR